MIKNYTSTVQAGRSAVSMPYIYDDFNKQTFFEKMKNSGFTLLEDRRTK
jgi:hypothetical protein